MSGDNVHRGPWGDRSDESGRSGGEPPGGSLVGRVISLEADVKEVKSTLGRIETTLVRIDERMTQFSTKEDAARAVGLFNALSEKVDGLSARVDKVERTVETKVVGPWQFPVILSSCLGVAVIFVGALNWLITHGWIGR